MTDTHIASAQQWIKRLGLELDALQARPDFRDHHAHTADGIREEIDRVRQLIALASSQSIREEMA